MQQKNKAVFRFWLILHVKNNLFKKRSKSARQIDFFKKKQKSFYLKLDFFNKFY